jgi:hypothetical protein
LTIGFQLALVAGKPWGHLTQGGRFTGVLPRSGRIVAGVSAAVLMSFIVIILTRSGHILAEYHSASVPATWVVVAYLALGLVMNLITPSKQERNLWVPVIAVMLTCAVAIAL